MSKKLLLATIASVLSINAYAVSSTVTSRDYVDAKDALKQNLIPATGTNSKTPGDTVVTYTSTAGTIGERGICAVGVEGCDNGDLVTRDLLGDAMDWVEWELQNVTDNLPETTVTYKTCTEWSGTPHTDANCLLWNLSDKDVYGKQCVNIHDCDSWCDNGCGMCVNGRCSCADDCNR